ncbi:MAG: flavodoxin family protein [Patescibacteria group bacterium]
MKSIIIYQSIHHKNTEKIAKVMAEVLDAKLVKPSEVKPEELLDYDLIGFGSGIYWWRHHRQLIDLAKKLPIVKEKMAFIFSTSGLRYGKKIIHYFLKKLLIKKGFKIIGEFNCPGYDTFGILKIFGGINKDRPNEKDLKKATLFALNLKDKII